MLDFNAQFVLIDSNSLFNEVRKSFLMNSNQLFKLRKLFCFKNPFLLWLNFVKWIHLSLNFSNLFPTKLRKYKVTCNGFRKYFRFHTLSKFAFDLNLLVKKTWAQNTNYNLCEGSYVISKTYILLKCILQEFILLEHVVNILYTNIYIFISIYRNAFKNKIKID